MCVLHSIFFEVFVSEVIFHPSKCCYCTKCMVLAFAQKQYVRPSKGTTAILL